MLFWHAGGTIAITRYAFRDEHMDLRFLVLGAIVADLVDTPIGFAFFIELRSVRLVLHSLTASAVVMIVVLWRTRRGRPRKRWMPIAIGMLLHLFLDAMWAEPETLWWPFLGSDFSEVPAATVGAYVEGVLTDWRTWVTEFAGLVYLVVLVRRGRLAQPEQRRQFLTTGTIDVPIGQR